MREITFAQAINEAIKEELRRDPAVIVLGEGVSTGGTYGVTKDITEEFGAERAIDTPSSEASVAGVALGAAMTGAKPVAEIKGPYLLRSADTIANQVSLSDYITSSQYESSLVIRADIGYKKNEGPQLSQSYESMFCQLPGLTVVYPSTPADAKGLMKSAIRHKSPVLFLENKNLYKQIGLVPEENDFIMPLSKADIKRTGDDLTIITYGPMTKLCLEAAKKAENEEIGCEVIDLRTLYPMDTETIIASVVKTGKALIVHEAHKTGGLGGEIAAVIADSEAFDYLEMPIKRLCSADMPIGYASELYTSAVPDTDQIYEMILELTC